ncbi:MAG: phosphotransferase family protein [Acidimicrobiales bacterium]|nr:phosphotransferase family protein [Acidimicrobiales bacterium]
MAQRELETTRRQLERWLSSVNVGATDIAVADLALPTAGASNETILFRGTWRADGDAHDERLVLRVQPVTYQLFLDGDVFHQWRAMQAFARQTSIPVPALRWAEPSPDVLGAPFYVMSHCDGDVPNGYQSALMTSSTPAQRGALLRNGLTALADIHRVDWRDGFGFLRRGDGEQGLSAFLDYVEEWYEWARAGRRFDSIEKGLRALRDRMPADAPTSLSWGDSRPGNIMFSPVDQSVVAVLDWELLQIATPEADLAWWWMFERLFGERMGGLPEGALTHEETLGRYEHALGRPIGDMGYFDLLAWARFAITMVRHVDLERGGPGEQMFVDLDAWVTKQLDEAVAARR